MQTGGAMPETSPSGSAKKSFPMPLLIGVAVVLVVAIAALLFL
jgi:hypothetical protein